MSGPKRIQLSRRKGFNLQAASLALNGLPCVNCSRPHRWGNSWKVGGDFFDRAIGKFRKCETVEDAIQGFRQSVEWDPDAKYYIKSDDGYLEIWGGYGPEHRNLKTIRAELSGKNLACWCALDEPCHADTLLELANPLPRPEAVQE